MGKKKAGSLSMAGTGWRKSQFLALRAHAGVSSLIVAGSTTRFATVVFM